MARVWRWLWQKLDLWLLLLLLLLLLRAEGPPPGALSTRLDRLTADLHFDFWGWETEALAGKLAHWLVQPQRYMAEADRVAFVRDYAAQVERIWALQGQIETIYADPTVADPDAQAASLRQALEELRAQMAWRQPVFEAIVEEQVSVALADEGLDILGQPFPPVGVRFTPLPYALIVSPRERIETIYSQHLQHGLDAAQQSALESRVDETFDVSSYVTGIGGLSAWPAMMLEHSYLPWLMEVAAHEWTHHYLYFHPLGWGYDRSQEVRTINETTASIVGKEVGRLVVVRYYPDLLPPEETTAPQQPTEPPAFDFRQEMHLTRVEVDRLLAEGLVEEAEAYMEARRVFFWEHGYRLRKLNQAYFAFHGSYADEPGAAGEDPVGPAVQRLRARSASLRAFLTRIDTITSLAELETALAATP